MVYTAGAAWIVDIAPPSAARPDHRPLRARDLGRSLASARRSARLLLRVSSFELVWASRPRRPLLGGADRRADPRTDPACDRAGGPWIQRRRAPRTRGDRAGRSARARRRSATRRWLRSSSSTSTSAGSAHGGAVFTAFALTVVAMRIVGGGLPDRFGPARCAAAAGLIEAIGLLTIAARRRACRS